MITCMLLSKRIRVTFWWFSENEGVSREGGRDKGKRASAKWEKGGGENEGK